MKRIQLTNSNKHAIIDDEDVGIVCGVPWYLNNGYAARMGPLYRGKRRIIYLHRVIAGAQHPVTGVKLKNRRVRVTGSHRLDNRRRFVS